MNNCGLGFLLSFDATFGEEIIVIAAQVPTETTHSLGHGGIWSGDKTVEDDNYCLYKLFARTTFQRRSFSRSDRTRSHLGGIVPS